MCSSLSCATYTHLAYRCCEDPGKLAAQVFLASDEMSQHLELGKTLTLRALLVQLADSDVMKSRPLERHQGPRFECERLVGVRRPGDRLGGCNADGFRALMWSHWRWRLTDRLLGLETRVQHKNLSVEITHAPHRWPLMST